jgi:hypothetical protein
VSEKDKAIGSFICSCSHEKEGGGGGGRGKKSTQLDVTDGIVLSYCATVSSPCPSNFTTDSPHFGSH